MPIFEYKVVPAPTKGLKAKGVKRADERFALALSEVMNRFGAEGWEYIRADILPAEERSGLASKQTVYHNMLVFRRALPAAHETTLPDPVEDEAPKALAPPEEDSDERDATEALPAAEETEGPRQEHAAQ